MELVNVHNSLTELKKNKTINGTLLNYEVGRTASQGSESKQDLEVKLLIITDHEGDLLFKKKLTLLNKLMKKPKKLMKLKKQDKTL